MNLSFPSLSDERYRAAIRDRVTDYVNGERVIIASRTSLYVVIERLPLFPFLPPAVARGWHIEVPLTGVDDEDEVLVNLALEEAAKRFDDEVRHDAQVRAARASKRHILAQASRSR